MASKSKKNDFQRLKDKIVSLSSKLQKAEWFYKPVLVYAAVILIAFLSYQQFGPKYRYLVTDNEYGLKLARYNIFTGEHERCWINKHRRNKHLQKYDKSSNSETISCHVSYEFTKEEMSKAELEEAVAKLKSDK